MSDKLRTIGGAIAEGRDLEDITAAVLRQIAIDNSSDHGRSPSRAPSSGDATARSANDSNSKDGDYNDTRGNNTGTTAIFVYSMSEVILIVGVAKAMQFIRTLKASASMALNSNNNNNSRSGLSSSSGSSSSRGGEYKSEDEAKLHEMSNGDLTTKLVDPQSRGADGKPVDSNSNSNSSSSLTVSIVALVHSSLHSAHTLSRLLPQPQPSHPSLLSSGSGSPFNASVIVKPNDGSLSARTYSTSFPFQSVSSSSLLHFQSLTTYIQIDISILIRRNSL